MKDYTVCISGKLIGQYETLKAAHYGAKVQIKRGETALFYYEYPYTHLIGEVSYEDYYPRVQHSSNTASDPIRSAV